MSFNNRKKLDTQLPGFIIAAVIVGCLYMFFYHKDDSHKRTQNSQYSEVQNNQQPNALENFEKDEQRRKEEAFRNAQTFSAKVMLRYSDDGSVRGPMQLMASNKKDAVFIIRNKLNNAIMAIVQVPRGDSETIMLPIGEFVIEYAQSDGLWLGLGELWGASTKFNKSRLNHRVYQELTPTGSRVRGVGILIDTEEGTISERISKKQFVSD